MIDNLTPMSDDAFFIIISEFRTNFPYSGNIAKLKQTKNSLFTFSFRAEGNFIVSIFLIKFYNFMNTLEHICYHFIKHGAWLQADV